MSFDDIDPFDVYEYFNIAESFAWFGAAIAVHFIARPVSRAQRVWLFAASVAFVLFGFSDQIESKLRGPMPLWLWAYKIGCAGLLMACRIGYIGPSNFRWNERFFLVLLGCLAASVATAIVHAFVF